MLSRVHRLEQMLVNWEDYCNLQEMAIRHALGTGNKLPVQLIGAWKHWHGLRQDILRREIFSELKYGMTPDVAHALQLFSVIPFYVWAWNYWSRRIFRITRELQAFLLATSVDSLTYGDLQMPFHSFMIELEEPLHDTDHDLVVDSILIVRGLAENPLAVENRLAIQAFPTDFDKIHPLNADDKKKMAEHLKYKRFTKLAKLHSRLCADFEKLRIAALLVDLADKRDVRITEPVEKVFGVCKSCGVHHPQHDEFLMKLIHIVAGLCFYLQTLPPGSPHKSDWMPLSKSARLDGQALTNQAEVCCVSNEYALTPEELHLFETQCLEHHHPKENGDGTEMRAHFRRGYWRRRPGSGNDPLAPKVIAVRPTIVRADRLPEGGIPGGNRIIL